MTLDREERKNRERLVEMDVRAGNVTDSTHSLWLREAHTRIEELEEALHARRLRCEELATAVKCAFKRAEETEAHRDQRVAELEEMLGLATKVNERAVAEQQGVLAAERRALAHLDRAEGYRKAAIILRDHLRLWESVYCDRDYCENRVTGIAPEAPDPALCWRHR